MMIGGPKRKLLGNEKKKEKEDIHDLQSFQKKVSEFEARIEHLQKALKDRDHAIVELKERNTKQEKKIDDQTRARLVKEKDATILELKERIRKQQQKKDDHTRARLAHSDSPVAKAVLDKTLQENKELHLRIEAMLLQAQDEKKNNQETIKKYKHDLDATASRNATLEKELEVAKAEMHKLLQQVSQLRETLIGRRGERFMQLSDMSHLPTPPSSPESTTQTTTTATTPRTTTLSTFSLSDSAPSDSMPADSAPSDSTPADTTPANTTPETTTVQATDVHADTTTHTDNTDTPGTPDTANGTPNGKEDNEYNLPTFPLRSDSMDLESYDLCKLAKELDADNLPSLSDLDLMQSMDSISPAQSFNFATLAQEEKETSVSPTARLEVRTPFHSESPYDHDFMAMFSPPNHLSKLKIKHYSPALNNLFYTEDKSPPPAFNLDGIDGAYLATNHDSEPSSITPPSRRPSSPFHGPSHSEPVLPSPPALSKSSPSPFNTPSSSSPLHRSTSSVPLPSQLDADIPTRSKGHKSIFSLFPSDDNDATRNGVTTSTDSLTAPTSSYGEATDATNPTRTHTPPPTLTSSTTLTPPPPSKLHDELLLSFGSKVDTNKTGLRRAKKVNFAAFATKGKVKVEPTMEDVHFCIYPYMKSKKRALFAVFDGHAGRAAADEAAALFPKEFNTQLEAYSQDVAQAFIKTFAVVDETMKEFEYLGTTATVVYLWQKEEHKYLQAANVGDSTAYLCRNGVSTKLTVDHKPSLAEEKERMRLSGIEVSDSQTRINGLAVSRSLGNHFVKEQNIGMIAIPYVGECVEILPTDTHLIVASDGLWDVVNSQHAMDIIRGLEALPAASLLLSTALASNKCNDNVSIIVVRLN